MSPAESFLALSRDLGLTVSDPNGLVSFCRKWLTSQQQYCNIFLMWRKIINALDNDINLDLGSIQDLHDQGYINYRVERRYNIEIPVNDYRDWFANTDELREMIQQQQ